MTGRLFISARPLLTRALCMMLDASILALLGVVIVIVMSGGGVIEVAGFRVRARTVGNPIWILAAAVALRYSLRSSAPFLGIRRFPVETCLARGITLVSEWIPANVTRLFRRPLRALVGVASVAALVKVLLGWTLPGFFSGDDVEIHQMSIGVLRGERWPIWELRSAFFPMVFIYPAQRLALALGALTPETSCLRAG